MEHSYIVRDEELAYLFKILRKLTPDTAAAKKIFDATYVRWKYGKPGKGRRRAVLRLAADAILAAKAAHADSWDDDARAFHDKASRRILADFLALNSGQQAGSVAKPLATRTDVRPR